MRAGLNDLKDKCFPLLLEGASNKDGYELRNLNFIGATHGVRVTKVLAPVLRMRAGKAGLNVRTRTAQLEIPPSLLPDRVIRS